MRTFAFCLLLALVARSGDMQKKVAAVSDDRARTAIAEFNRAFKTKDLSARQNAIYNLHDVPHPLVVKQLVKVLRNRDRRLRNVAALALGGQAQDVKAAGAVLMRIYKKDFKVDEVLASVVEAMAELNFMGYWPTVKPAMKDERSAVVIRILDLLGANRDWRAIPTLLEMYRVAMPTRVKWTTGEVKVDTGASGDADQKAAEAKFNAKYGSGGSKEKSKAKAKARAFDERNFTNQLRQCVKKITGEDFDTAMDFEDWYLDRYVEVHRRIARLMGKDPGAAGRKAKAELPPLKAKFEEERRKLEARLDKERKK